MTAVDISKTFLRHAKEAEENERLGIRYEVASAVELPFEDDAFDFATSFMSLMDIPETERVFAEAHRIVRPGGFLQFSITHPCFDTPHRKNLRDEDGIILAVEVGEYFRGFDGEAKEGLRPFRVPLFSRTLSEWLHLVLEAGFIIERVGEPCPSDDAIKHRPYLRSAKTVPFFLHIRARKRRLLNGASL